MDKAPGLEKEGRIHGTLSVAADQGGKEVERKEDQRKEKGYQVLSLSWKEGYLAAHATMVVKEKEEEEVGESENKHFSHQHHHFGTDILRKRRKEGGSGERRERGREEEQRIRELVHNIN